MLFRRPEATELRVERREVPDATCPACSSNDVREYPVLRVTGWRLVWRCQSCLSVLQEEEPPTPLGFTYKPHSVYLRGDPER